MSTGSPEDQDRLSNRRLGVFGMILGLMGVLLGAYLSNDGGTPSPKANATLFICGVAGFTIIGMASLARDLTFGDRVRLGVLFALSMAALFVVDYGGLLEGGGRVATPLVVAIAAGVWSWWRHART